MATLCIIKAESNVWCQRPMYMSPGELSYSSHRFSKAESRDYRRDMIVQPGPGTIT